MTQAQISRIETGPPVTDLISLIHYARVLGVPVERLWFSVPGVVPPQPVEQPSTSEFGSAANEVTISQNAWRNVRRYLNTHRSELSRAASALYPVEFHVPGTALLMPPEWSPLAPLEIEHVRLRWMDGAATKVPLVDGSEPEARQILPMYSPSRVFERYTQAIRYINSPSLFENRPSYRLTGVEWDRDGGGELSFGLATYFDKLDVSEALGHEFAAATAKGLANWARLPFRRLVSDPFDMDLRAVVPAITTLLIRVRDSGEATFLLHWRDPGKVATAGGLYDTIPAGEFQPSTIAGDPAGSDFDLWHNIVRELNEELLGAPEYDGSGSRPLDYDRWPLYRALERARRARRIRLYCFGVGCDALTLAATIPTALVIEDDVFEELFGEVVKTNAEGVTVIEWNGQDTSAGIPFTEQNVLQFIRDEPMAPPGAACLALAWKYRDLLLGS
ncbi:XRE family transcriptional regulator [Kitasatospora xanthocidica]|uniref:XRE family transcriptional regulator n=1 Tax=Kitasatospora xanthocidica TaxID=83382 RepID=A0A372ZU65_9ACTN|nr:XRE family transcriptional regulator [Kitasatospora xanthocidica]RGD59024.1 XRE family transcriptional regulator [Kitasatospora xanthocidica]